MRHARAKGFHPSLESVTFVDMRDIQKLEVWQQAHQLVLDVFADTDRFPSREQFGLADQLRRAVVSVASNLAEGAARASRKDYARFVDIAIGSANEAAYQLLIARDLGMLNSDVHAVRSDQAEAVRRKLANLRREILSDNRHDA
jgi:four helix bundle protein